MPASMMAIVAAADDVAACAPCASSSACALVPVATTASAVSLTTTPRRNARSSVLRKWGMAADYIMECALIQPCINSDLYIDNRCEELLFCRSYEKRDGIS